MQEKKESLNHKMYELTNNWSEIAPLLKKLLRPHGGTIQEWRQLFINVHVAMGLLWNKDACFGFLDNIKVEINIATKEARDRIVNRDDECLLQAYTKEWDDFFIKCGIVYRAFRRLDEALKRNNSSAKTNINDEQDNIVRKLMLDTWSETVFSDIRERLQNSAMKLVEAERNGESFDPQLVIAVRESFVNLCSDQTEPLKIYYTHFEKPYREASKQFYGKASQEYESNNGIVNYMSWADVRLKEEQRRAEKYLESREQCFSVNYLMDDLVTVLVQNYQTQIFGEYTGMIERK